MAGFNNIKVTPETLDAQGKALKGYGVEIEDLLTKIKTKIDEIDSGWDGLAQNSYIQMYTTMEKSLKEFPKVVKSLGEITCSTAKAYMDLDEKLKTEFSKVGQ